MHGDDILLSGPRSLVDAVRNSLRKRYEIREQMLGAGPKDASEIIMLNRRVQWTEAGIRISPDPRHVKDIIEELGLEGAKPADTPMVVSQSSKKDSDSRALSMRDATLCRRLVAKLNYLAMDRPEFATLHRPWEAKHQARKMRTWSDSKEWCEFSLGDQSPGRTIDGGCDQTESWHTRTVIGQQTRQAFSEWRDACPQWRTLEILVKNAQGGVAFVVGERAFRCGVNWSGGSWSSKWTQRLREQHACDDRMRQPGSGGPHRTSGTRVGEARAHETSLAASSKG